MHELNFQFFLSQKEKELFFLCSQKVLNQREIDRLHQLAMDTEVDVIYPHIKDGLTPLMMLTSYNNSDTFRQCFDALLQRDEINVCVQEEKGINALHCLFLYNCKNVTVDIIRQLAQRGIDLTSVDRVENRSVLHYLCLYGHECEDFCNVIRFLVECGLNVQAKTKKGDSALTLLCQHYSEDQLLEATRFSSIIHQAMGITRTTRGRTLFTIFVKTRTSKLMVLKGSILHRWLYANWST
jgi:ankyrin repeat protein